MNEILVFIWIDTTSKNFLRALDEETSANMFLFIINYVAGC